MRKLALVTLLFPFVAFANEPVAAPAAVVPAPAVVSAAADAAAPASAPHDAGVPSSAAPDAAPSVAPSVAPSAAPSAPASVAVVEEAPESNTPFIMLGCIIAALAGLVVIWKKKA